MNRMFWIYIVVITISGCAENRIRKLLPGSFWIIEEAVYLNDQDITPYMRLNTIKFFEDNTCELPKLDLIEGGENRTGKWDLETRNDSLFLVIYSKSWIFSRSYYINIGNRKQGDAIIDEIYLHSDTLYMKASR